MLYLLNGSFKFQEIKRTSNFLVYNIFYSLQIKYNKKNTSLVKINLYEIKNYVDEDIIKKNY